jgi:hypothetical protein
MTATTAPTTKANSIRAQVEARIAEQRRREAAMVSFGTALALYVSGAKGSTLAEPGTDIKFFSEFGVITRNPVEEERYSVSLCGRYSLGGCTMLARVSVSFAIVATFYGADLDELGDGITVTGCSIEIFHNDQRIATAGCSLTRYLTLTLEEIEAGVGEAPQAHMVERVQGEMPETYMLEPELVGFESCRLGLAKNFAREIERAMIALLFPREAQQPPVAPPAFVS